MKTLYLQTKRINPSSIYIFRYTQHIHENRKSICNVAVRSIRMSWNKQVRIYLAAILIWNSRPLWCCKSVGVYWLRREHSPSRFRPFIRRLSPCRARPDNAPLFLAAATWHRMLFALLLPPFKFSRLAYIEDLNF